MTGPAAEAAGLLRELPDPRGCEIFVPRAMTPAEVRGTRTVPQGIGWRHRPGAHGLAPCTCFGCLQPGTPEAAAMRRRSPDFEPRVPKPELMARLRAAVTPEEITAALQALGGRGRGGAEELAYLAEHSDAHVREALHILLDDYRGRTARRLPERLADRGVSSRVNAVRQPTATAVGGRAWCGAGPGRAAGRV